MTNFIDNLVKEAVDKGYELNSIKVDYMTDKQLLSADRFFHLSDENLKDIEKELIKRNLLN